MLFLNHGGQNSLIDGLVYGVPQLICAGKVFERKYNAQSIVKIGAGLELSHEEFTSASIRTAFEEIISKRAYQENALKIGRILLSLGGTEKIIENLER